MTGLRSGPQTPWSDAQLAACMIAIDPHGLKGVRVLARAGPVLDCWLERLSGIVPADMPVRRVGAGISAQRLVGGLDVARSVERGARVTESGVLAGADRGLLVLAMAERLEASAAALIGAALDHGKVRIERDGVSALEGARFALVALDEGIEDEGLPHSLADRLALRVDLHAMSLRELQGTQIDADLAAASAILPAVEIEPGLVETLCAAALLAGGSSMRTPMHLLRVARASAALRGSTVAEVTDIATALRLVLGVQFAAPEQEAAAEEETAPEPEPASENNPEDAQPLSSEAMNDMLVQSAAAVLPAGLLASLRVLGAKARRGAAGKAGALRKGALRGRAVGTTDRPPAPGARIDVLATLRQAAPWQRLRGKARPAPAAAQRRLEIRKSDFRFARYREKSSSTAIFAVDASGSAAVERLAETKGAVELLLAQCYVRRDQVALIAFRGRRSQALLEPTRSLVRAKKCLSALPGGGGTPLAHGILATLAMAGSSARRGQSVVAVFLTDGRGNVGLDGGTAKSQVAEDTAKAARNFRAAGVRAIVIDTGQRPQQRAEALAHELGAEYLALPRGGSTAIARAIGQRMER